MEETQAVVDLFQFLSRNSVRWDLHTRPPSPTGNPFQFLSRNSVRWDQCICCTSQTPLYLFQFLSRNSVRWDWLSQLILAIFEVRFNSSVGILSVGTKFSQLIGQKITTFQFLSRNSVRWDLFLFKLFP